MVKVWWILDSLLVSGVVGPVGVISRGRVALIPLQVLVLVDAASVDDNLTPRRF